MRRVEWAAGRRRALVLDGVALLVDAEVDRDQLVAMWDRLATSEVTGLGTLLEVLGEVTGAPLSSLPDFAMAVLDDKGLHVAARGGCRVRVVHADGTELDLDGAEVSTWLERNVDAASTAHVCLGADTDGGGWLPLVGGVVPAGAVRLLVADHELPEEPRTAPHPPILLGGESDGALARAVRVADGWISAGSVAKVEGHLATLARLREDALVPVERGKPGDRGARWRLVPMRAAAPRGARARSRTPREAVRPRGRGASGSRA